MKKNDTSWGGVADWYDKHLTDDTDSYHTQVILPHLTRLMDISPTHRVLDLACGTGFFTRAWREHTEHVLGADISPELISIAREHSKDVQYIVTSSHELSAIADASYDRISCVLAIQNIEKVKETFAECARILAPGGSVFLVMNHPAFRIPHMSSWGWDEEGRQYRRIDAYTSESKAYIDAHPGKKKKQETISFHRPLQYYAKACAASGLAIARLEEWSSHRKSQSGPRQKEEDRMRKEIPLFMCLELKRLS